MSSIPDITLMLLRGIHVTLIVLVLSIVLSSVIAMIAGLSRVSQNKLLTGFTGVYVEIFRGTSLIVQLFWLSYALPGLFNIHLGSDIWVAVLAISLNYGAYMSEIVRGAILSVPQGQTEASIALNLIEISKNETYYYPPGNPNDVAGVRKLFNPNIESYFTSIIDWVN